MPNAVIGNGRIVNETGGPHDKMRVRVKVSAAYGSDVDQVRDVLLGRAARMRRYLVGEPAPRVRFRTFGDSGLDFELLAWIEQPLYRGRVLDELNRRVYKAFAARRDRDPLSQAGCVREGTSRGGIDEMRNPTRWSPSTACSSLIGGCVHETGRAAAGGSPGDRSCRRLALPRRRLSIRRASRRRAGRPSPISNGFP